MKAFIIFQCLVLLWFSGLASGGNDIDPISPPPFRSEGEGPNFVLDYANYRGVEDLTYIEFYFQVGYHELQFIKHGEDFQAKYTLDFQIKDAQGHLIELFRNDDAFEVQTFDETKSFTKARVMMIAVSLGAGRYRIAAKMRDRETHRLTQITRRIEVVDFRASRLQVSDIQFSQKIKRAADGPFVKNMRYIEPNALRAFGEDRADIYVYFEIYNLVYFENQDNYFYLCDYRISDEDGETLRTFEQANRSPGFSSAHSVKLPGNILAPGTYKLHITVTDQATGVRAETSQTFTILKESMILVDSHEIF